MADLLTVATVPYPELGHFFDLGVVRRGSHGHERDIG